MEFLPLGMEEIKCQVPSDISYLKFGYTQDMLSPKYIILVMLAAIVGLVVLALIKPSYFVTPPSGSVDENQAQLLVSNNSLAGYTEPDVLKLLGKPDLYITYESRINMHYKIHKNNPTLVESYMGWNQQLIVVIDESTGVVDEYFISE